MDDSMQRPREVTPTTSRHAPKVALFVFGSFVFGYNAAQIVHELGHVLSGLLAGGRDFHISSHPFSWSYASVDGCRSTEFMVWGGLLWSDVLALLVFATTYRRRSASLFPILLWCSLSFLVNGIYFAAGTGLGVGDPSSLMSLGVGPILLLAIGTVCLLVGGLFLIISAAVLGLQDHRHNHLRPLFAIGLPVATYLAMILLYTVVYASHEIHVWGTFVGAGVVATYVLCYLIHRVGDRFTPKKSEPVSWRMVGLANIAGVSVVLIQLTLLSQ